MPTILFTPSGSEATDRKIRRDHDAGKLTRVANGVYVEMSAEPIETTIQRNWYAIVGRLVADGVVTDRTGMDNQPWRDRSSGRAAGDAYVFVSAPRARDVLRLPGLVISIREGAGPAEGDPPYLGTRLAGPIRKLLDNLTPSRARGGPARTVGAIEVERHLEKICSSHGEEHLNYIRDQARLLAPTIGKETEFEELNRMISTLLRTREAKMRTLEGAARAKGAPLDAECVTRLVTLANYLNSRAPYVVESRDTTPGRKVSGAFIEAYFSNFIEGTEFSVEEAVEIVFEGKIPDARPEDGHDVLGAYLQLLDLGTRPSSALSADEFLDEIQARHHEMMKARPGVLPGQFKTKPNQAGDTTFVRPDQVKGTIREGMSILRTLTDPFSRALFIHFMLSDVHPFNDGNGRLSRIMMTKELILGGRSRIVIPTVFRTDYLDALRALTRRGEPSIFVRSMEFCQKVSAACSEETTAATIETWARAYAFCESPRHARLMMPNPAIEVEFHEGTPAPAEYWQAIGYDSGSVLSL